MLDLIINDSDRIIQKVDMRSLNNKRVLITGATGLIGLHLLSVLKTLKVKYNYNIDIYCWVFSDIEKHLMPMFEGCAIIKADLTDVTAIDNLQKMFVETLSGVDYIFHAAGYGQPQRFTSNKIKTIELNTVATTNLFKLLNSDGRFLFCSTSEIYSGIDQEGIEETRIGTTSPDHHRACYIEGKRCGEAICHAFTEKGFTVKIARISLAYGPGTKKNDTRVMNNLIQKGLVGNTITLLDSGDSIRTYGYVADVAEMLFNILLHGKQSVYNVGGESKLSVLELAQKVGSYLNCSVNTPSKSEGLTGNPKIVNVSLDRYLREFGEIKFETIDSGLSKTIEWQKQIYSE